MVRPEHYLKIALETVKGHAVFSTIPWGLLLVGLEKIIEVDIFSCPCVVELNRLLTAAMFIGPAFVAFALTFTLLRPCKHGWSHCCSGKKDTEKTFPKALATCIILPAVWFTILLFHGEYIACAMTDWKGVYVLDKELDRSWCKPTEKMLNETELRDLTLKHIYKSQCAGYFCMGFFCVFVIVVLSINDCCVSGKCCCFCGINKNDEPKRTSPNPTQNPMFSSEPAEDV